jgi:hypothetical protein
MKMQKDIRPRYATGAVMLLAPIACAVFCMLMFSSCEESLPPRDDPQNFLATTIEGGYLWSVSAESIYFTVKIRNTYSETFSDTTSIFGTIAIQLKDDPAFQRHFELTAADLKAFYYNPLTGSYVQSTSSYNNFSKILTMPENSIAVFQVRWNLQSDNSIDLRRITQYHPDPLNPHVLVTDEIAIAVTAGVHLYKAFPMLYPEPILYKPILSRPQ